MWVPRVMISPATMGGVQLVSERLRASDVEEIQAAMGDIDPRVGLWKSVESSEEAWEAWSGADALCIFGVGRFPSGGGCPWMLGTDAIGRHRIGFMEASHRWVSGALGRWGYLENFVYAGSRHAVEWLEALGFTIHEAAPYGARRLPFHRFTMGEKPCAPAQ